MICKRTHYHFNGALCEVPIGVFTDEQFVAYLGALKLTPEATMPVEITDEMIERGAMVLEQKLWASSSWSHDMSEAVLRAALEVER
jgi:hypothetical protein